MVLYPLSFLRSQRVCDMARRKCPASHAFGSDPLSDVTLGSETHIHFDLSYLKVIAFLKTKSPNPASPNGILQYNKKFIFGPYSWFPAQELLKYLKFPE